MNDEAATGRRTFTKVAAGLLGSLVGSLLAVPGVAYVLDPLLRRRADASAFREVAEESVLRDDQPVAVSIIGEKRDAWTRAKNQNLGTVWLRRKDDGSVLALSAECPHLGCKVGYDADASRFACPCHEAAFDLEGRVLDGPPKRGMDALDARVRDGLVEIRFKRFRTNVEEQVEVG